MILNDFSDMSREILKASTRIVRRLLGRSTLIDTLEALLDVTVGLSVSKVADKYQIRGGYQLPSAIRDQYSRCVSAAGTTFLQSLLDPSRNLVAFDELEEWENYFQSDVVSTELSKLLEPGVAEFDVVRLSDYFLESLNSNAAMNLSKAEIENAWIDFQKAFSFAARSMPELREFIRASYEEGSFNALTDIRVVADQMNRGIDHLTDQESKLNTSMDDYENELKSHQEWAKNFDKDRKSSGVH